MKKEEKQFLTVQIIAQYMKLQLGSTRIRSIRPNLRYFTTFDWPTTDRRLHKLAFEGSDVRLPTYQIESLLQGRNKISKNFESAGVTGAVAVAEFPAGRVVFSPLIGCESGRQYLTTFVIGPRHYITMNTRNCQSASCSLSMLVQIVKQTLYVSRDLQEFIFIDHLYYVHFHILDDAVLHHCPQSHHQDDDWTQQKI